MRKYKIFFYIFLFLVVAIFGVNQYINYQLPKIIEKKNDSEYKLSFDDFNFSILKKSITIENAKVYPKSIEKLKKDVDFFGKIGEISIRGINFWELLVNKNFEASEIEVIQPKLKIITPKPKAKNSSEEWKKAIRVGQIKISEADITVLSSNTDSLNHKLYNLNAVLGGLDIETEKKALIDIQNYEITVDSVFSKLSPELFVKTQRVEINPDIISIKNSRAIPYLSQQQFKHNQTISNSRFYCDIPSIKIYNTDWGTVQDKYFIKTGGIVIDTIHFKLTNQKQQTVVQQAKADSKQIIQPLIPVELEVDSLVVKQSNFQILNEVDIFNVALKARHISNKMYHQLQIDTLWVNQAQIIHTKKEKKQKKSTQQKQSNLLNDSDIIFNHIALKNMQYLQQEQHHKKMSIQNINVSVDSLKFTNQSVKKTIPFIYHDIKATAENFWISTGKIYDFTIQNIDYINDKLNIKNLALTPKISKKAHAHQLKWGEDYYTISVPKIQVADIQLGHYNNKNVFVDAKKLTVINPKVHIFRDAAIPNEPVKNTLYSEKLRNINFPFYLDQLVVQNALLTYSETTAIDKAPGKLTFKNMNVNAFNIYSGKTLRTKKQTQAQVDAIFMQNSDLQAQWTFNIMDTQDKFKIKGTLLNFDAPSISPFIYPYLKVKILGDIHNVSFDFMGNDNFATGTFGIKFSDIKVKVFNEENKEKKLISAIGNLFVKNNSDGEEKVKIKKVQRQKENSFFNFFWQCILQGLKQTLL